MKPRCECRVPQRRHSRISQLGHIGPERCTAPSEHGSSPATFGRRQPGRAKHLRLSSVPASAQGPSGAAGAAGPPPATNVSSNKRLQQTQAQVDEVVDIMRMNVDKVLERDQKLSELDNRADALQAGASQFETSAAKLKRKYWWKNCKMMIILGVVCAVILIIIIIYFST
ncbi:PREDICTED: vesicle-associated membrane protein 2-like [Sturnus vulgaris]|uniref:vesicle-associated membrane protein 2-like n=1 Tax=Sturnus vulgaris TaxID=9172 RepID=UPI00071A6D5B|nr:PREDICTED: vesicle-associated membrane protein 2-like [Sturnus vulgaris]